MAPRPPTSTLFPYTTLFRSARRHARQLRRPHEEQPLVRERRRLDTARLHLDARPRSEEHTSELQSLRHLVCRLLLEKKNKHQKTQSTNTKDISANAQR